jgi:hypothetical protein
LYTIEKEYFCGIFYFFTLDTMPRPNASIVLSGRDRNTPTPRNYNSAVFSQTNQNIVQGQIYSVAVSEVNFPYDIPNIQDGFNVFFIEWAYLGPAGQIAVTVPSGFYTGAELAAAINAQIAIECAQNVPIVPPQNAPICGFDPVTNLFSFIPAPAPFVPVQANVIIFSPYTFWDSGLTPRNVLGKDIMSIMGFQQSQGAGYATQANNNPLLVAVPVVGSGQVFSAQSAPLVFTQYIDICSPQLCKFQYFRDGSTTNLARRVDIICRLYISNNIAVGDTDGTRPFVINRQFQNPRVMRWTADNAIGQIDINLYDDVGQPLRTTWEPRPYQITFLAYELEKD